MRLLILTLAMIAAPAAAQQAVHDPGTVRLEVFSNGALGAQAGSGVGFEFLGANTLFDGRLIVGTGPGRVSGAAYDSADWTSAGPVQSQPASPPFNQIYRATFSDAAAPNPLGITVTQLSGSGTSAPAYVAIQYTITNTGTAALPGVYVGLFADFDVSGFRDLGRRDTPRALVYTYDPAATNPYVGIGLTGTAPISGWRVTFPASITDADLFTAMTTPGTVPTSPDDRVSVVGSGPYTIPAGGSITVPFAVAGGRSLADLRAATSGLFSTPTETDAVPGGASLRAAVPNPTSASTVLAFHLDAPGAVRLSVVDALGRETVVVADGQMPAGDHVADVDASALAPGVYAVRLAAAGRILSRRLTVVR